MLEVLEHHPLDAGLLERSSCAAIWSSVPTIHAGWWSAGSPLMAKLVISEKRIGSRPASAQAAATRSRRSRHSSSVA